MTRRTAAAALPTRVFVVALLAVMVAAQSTVRGAPTLEDQVHAIAKDLMCPVCAGQTVADSGSQLAQQMRAEIRQRLQAGQTREEIIAYFVGQFGEGALASPRPKGSGLVLWLSLPLAFLLGVFLLRRFLRGNLTAACARPEGPPPATPEEAEQIAQALRRLDDSR
jgi:cytochrome c-type biogenesis protein CcmH